jgi:hypothetical protein
MARASTRTAAADDCACAQKLLPVRVSFIFFQSILLSCALCGTALTRSRTTARLLTRYDASRYDRENSQPDHRRYCVSRRRSGELVSLEIFFLCILFSKRLCLSMRSSQPRILRVVWRASGLGAHCHRFYPRVVVDMMSRLAVFLDLIVLGPAFFLSFSQLMLYFPQVPVASRVWLAVGKVWECSDLVNLVNKVHTIYLFLVRFLC